MYLQRRCISIVLLLSALLHGCGALRIWGPAGSSGPSAVDALTKWSVAVGYYHTCVAHDGSVWCWGRNLSGQNGNSLSVGSQLMPYQLSITGIQTPQVASGFNHSCANVDGSLWCWGGNGSGQIGRGVVSAPVFAPYQSFVSDVRKVAIRGVSFGETTCTIVLDALYCFGDNSAGQIGNNSSGVAVLSPHMTIASGVTDLAMGTLFGCAVVSGAVYCWGRNANGRTGLGTTAGDALLPAQVLASGATQVAAGGGHACAVVYGGLKCWGSNSSGQLGTGTLGGAYYIPTSIIASGVSFVAVALSATCVIISGALQCWGDNARGIVGNGSVGGNVLTPYTVFSSGVTQVSLGTSHACAVVHNELWCWGSNDYGQVDGGTMGVDVSTPVKVNL